MADATPVRDSAALKAAKWLIHAEIRWLSKRDAARGNTVKPSIRQAAERFHTTKSRVGAHYKALRETGLPAWSPLEAKRPRALRDDEDEALVAYAKWLAESGSLASRDILEDAANLLRARRNRPAPPVSRRWWSRWKEAHSNVFRATLFKPMEAARMSAEQRLDDINAFYDKLSDAVETYNIPISGCWNADEMGCMLAMVSGRLQILVIQAGHRDKVTLLASPHQDNANYGILLASGCGYEQQGVYDPHRMWERYRRCDSRIQHLQTTPY